MDIYGHRGAKGVAMENSIAGFQLAASQGSDRFELDVPLSSDGQLMGVHDEKLKRLAHSQLLVSQSSAFDLSNTFLRGTQQGIPTLESVVLACPNVKHWQFEIKTQLANPGFIQPMAQLIEKYQLQDSVVITSKHIGILKLFRASLPHIERGYVQEWPLPNGLKTALSLECKYLCMSKSLARKSIIKKAQTKGLLVSIWTVNDADDMVRLHQYGADSIISDFPQAAKQVVSHLNEAK